MIPESKERVGPIATGLSGVARRTVSALLLALLASSSGSAQIRDRT